MRDIAITAYYFTQGNRDAVRSALSSHYTTAFLDLFILGGLCLWVLPDLGNTPEDEMANEDNTTFMTVTMMNCILSFVYVAAHICAMPLAWM